MTPDYLTQAQRFFERGLALDPENADLLVGAAVVDTAKAANFLVDGAVLHYLKAVQAAGTKEAKAVMAKMHELPVDDFYTKGARVRQDGLVARDYYSIQVKDPENARYKYDLYDVLATIPASETARPIEQSECPLVQKQ